MKVRLPLLASVLVLAACQDSDITSPPKVLPAGAVSQISDGANSGGNTDFWFLSPMVSNPNGNPLYNNNGFNAALQPTVTAVDLSNSFEVLPPTTATVNGNHYALNWKIPKGANKTYRVTVSVGLVTLGFADVSTAKNPPAGFVKQNDGSNLAIKFVIENYALCDIPGMGPCSSETINTSQTSEVTLILPGYGESGVTVPPQDDGEETTITLEPCDADNPGFTDMNPAVTDLPTYGPCMVIEANPPLSGPLDSDAPAIVFVCDITPDLAALSHDQQHLVTLHKYDPGVLKALPHAPHPCPPAVGFRGSVKGFFASVFGGEFKSAGRQLASLFTPRPLYAAAMLDVGAGGLTLDFSAFQFALPSKLSIVEGDNQVAAPGSTLPIDPKVMVTDLDGAPVAGATVRFVTNLADCNDTGGQVTGPVGPVPPTDGFASTSWMISATPGSNTLYACGRGLAGDDNNGPRTGVDPFQPVSPNFDAPGVLTDGPPELVEIGSVEFNATGSVPDPLLVDYKSAGWSYQIDGEVPADWTDSPTSPFGTTGPAPFRSPDHVGCPLNAAVLPAETSWPTATSTFLYARRTVSISQAGRIEVKVAIDNDVQVFVDGADISGGLVEHEGCPALDSFTFTSGLLAPGSYVVAVLAKDRGGSSYFDAKISYLPPLVILRPRRTP